MTLGEKAFVAHLKRVVPTIDQSNGGGERVGDKGLLKLFWEMHEDWQAACYWAWSHPEEGVGVGPPGLRQGVNRCKPGKRVLGATWEGILPDEETGYERVEQG